MDGEEIGLVLVRALELRSKINQCINRSGVGSGGHGSEMDLGACRAVEEDDEEEEDETAESLVGIRDALDSLERQLTALQALQQQQRYERESILTQIDRSRMILLSKLMDYKGEGLEVIHEVATFAGEKIEHDDGFVLPPYSSHLPNFFVLDDIYPTKYKAAQNGSIANSKLESKSTKSVKELNHNTSKGIGHFFGFVAKSALTFVSVISILSFVGYQPILKKWSRCHNSIQLCKQQYEERRDSTQCPPGKVLVIEDGKPRCLIKERIEVPFESDVTTPDIRYGFG